jgi:hypothetical protein
MTIHLTRLSYIVTANADRGCSACTCEDETIEHMISSCPVSMAFWIMMSRLLCRLLVGVPEEASSPTLLRIVYFYPELRDTLTADQLHVLTGLIDWVLL